MKKPKLPLLFTCGIIILSFLTGLFVGISPQPSHAEPDPIDEGIEDPLAKVNATYARGDSWAVSYQDGNYVFSTSPQWVYNGANYAPYIFIEEPSYYQVQSGYIGVRIYKDGYAEFWNPNMTEVRLYEEMWEVQYWTGSKWQACDVYSPTHAVSSDATTVNITASYITDWPNDGERAFTVKYIFREASPLKHEVEFVSHSSEAYEFRVIQRWAGIVATKVKHDVGEDTITGPVEVDSAKFKFLKEDDSLSVFENQRDMYYGYNETGKYVLVVENLKPVEINVHAQGLKADFVFSNWTLAQDEKLTIDPASSTFQPPTLDGHIEYRGGAFDEVDADADHFRYGEDKAASYHWYRSYIRFDITSLNDGAIVSEAVFSIWKMWPSYDGGREGDLYLTEIEDIGTSLTSADWGRSVIIDHGIINPLADWADEDMWKSLDCTESITGLDTFVSFRLKMSTEDSDTNAWKAYGVALEHATASWRPKIVVTYTLNTDPTNDACDSDATFDVDVDGWVNATVVDTDGGYLDLETVEINVTTASSEVFIFRWTNNTGLFSELVDASNVATLDTGTSERANINGTADTYCFFFKVNAVPIKGACSVNVTSVDSADASDSDIYAAEFSINFYLGITVNDGSHSWASMNPGITDQALSDDEDIDVTIDANANFDLEAKGDGALASGGDTIALSNVEMHETTLGSAIDLTTSYQDIPDLTDETRGVNQAKAFKLWISIPNPQQDGTYTYTLSVKGTEH